MGQQTISEFWSTCNGALKHISFLGLRVVPSTQGMIRHGEFVTLTCDNNCNLPGRPSFTWFKDGHRLRTKNRQELFLLGGSFDKGTYTCAISGRDDIPSTGVEISIIEHSEYEIQPDQIISDYYSRWHPVSLLSCLEHSICFDLHCYCNTLATHSRM